MIRILNSMLRSLISMAALVKREAIKMLILKKHTNIHNGCFWKFMPKKYLRQISILGTNTKESVKLKVQLVCQFLSWFYNSAFIFSDFLLIGTSNRDLFQILFGQKLPKTAIVHKADQTRATASLQVQSVNAGAARLNFSLPLSSEHRLTFLVCMATWLIKLVPIWYIFQLFFFLRNL